MSSKTEWFGLQRSFIDNTCPVSFCPTMWGKMRQIIFLNNPKINKTDL